MVKKIYELKATRQKSYYGKAQVIESSRGVFLKSYDTVVCGYVNGSFVRMWDAWSRTTANHVDDFRRLYSESGICKKDWCKMPVDYSINTFDIVFR